MKILVSFEPNKKVSDFEGARLRKTIKGSLEMVGVDYTSNFLDSYDVAHLISPIDDSIIKEIKEKNIPIIASALYCENDPLASYLEYKVTKKGEKIIHLTNRSLKFLNKVDLVLVPSERARAFLINEGVITDIAVVLPGINLSRFNLARDDEKEIFYRYFREDPKKQLVVGLGNYDSKMTGINTMINAARKVPGALFYYIGRETKLNALKSLKLKAIMKLAPKNIKFVNIVPDDIYRSALMNASVFVIPEYRTLGIVSVMDAMAAKCQIIARKQDVISDLLIDNKNAYIGEFSETLTSLTKDYLLNKIKPTINEAYKEVSKCNLKAFGEQLKFYYQEQINNKQIKE